MKRVSISILILTALLPAEALASVKDDVKKGNVLYNSNRYADAAKAYSQAASGNHSDGIAAFNLGVVKYKEKGYAAAIDKFNSAISSDRPGLIPPADYNIANAHYRIGSAAENTDIKKAKESYETALKFYKRSIDLNPSDKDAKFNYEFVEKKLNDLAEKYQFKKDEKKDQEKDKNKDKQDQKQNQQQNQQQPQSQQDKQQQNEKQQQNQEEQKQDEQQKSQQQKDREKQDQRGQSGESKEKSSEEKQKEQQQKEGQQQKEEQQKEGQKSQQQKEEEQKKEEGKQPEEPQAGDKETGGQKEEPKEPEQKEAGEEKQQEEQPTGGAEEEKVKPEQEEGLQAYQEPQGGESGQEMSAQEAKMLLEGYKGEEATGMAVRMRKRRIDLPEPARDW